MQDFHPQDAVENGTAAPHGHTTNLPRILFRRPILAAAMFAVAVFGAGLAPHGVDAATAPRPATTTFRVVGTGDSILHLVRAAGYLVGPGWSIDTEQGRDAVTPGNQGRMSTTQAFAAALTRSQPGGWIVVQDNGHGATDAQWRAMLRTMVVNTPNDRCLLGVFPAFAPQWSVTANTDARAKASIMAQEFAAQPCRAFVYWNTAVYTNSNLVYDGQHPGAAGISWLARSIMSITG